MLLQSSSALYLLMCAFSFLLTVSYPIKTPNILDDPGWDSWLWWWNVLKRRGRHNCTPQWNFDPVSLDNTHRIQLSSGYLTSPNIQILTGDTVSGFECSSNLQQYLLFDVFPRWSGFPGLFLESSCCWNKTNLKPSPGTFLNILSWQQTPKVRSHRFRQVLRWYYMRPLVCMLTIACSELRWEILFRSQKNFLHSSRVHFLSICWRRWLTCPCGLEFRTGNPLPLQVRMILLLLSRHAGI